MLSDDLVDRRVGIAIVGVGGAVATTVAAGLELLRLGLADTDGLPLAEVKCDLPPYGGMVVGGWDVSADDLATASEAHGVLGQNELAATGPALSVIRPWPAVGDRAYCRNIDGDHRITGSSLRAAVDTIRRDLRRFRHEHELDSVVMVNLASTERPSDVSSGPLVSLSAFERALDMGDAPVGPSALYAYAALREAVPYANFTPSVAVDSPALRELAEQLCVPVAGKDGKTGQTLMKTVIAPGLRARALRVDGWFSTNILGNRDGLALEDADSRRSKLDTKGSVLDDILGYHVADHVVRIEYYRPRGDDKEAWDTIDLVGFLGRRMQLKLNFLCRDSILAAPLVIEIARLLDCADRRGEGGVQEQLGAFFKAPMTVNGQSPVHALHRQEEMLAAWLGADQPARTPR
jgi:myo-inositol-1-phosphate synthase